MIKVDRIIKSDRKTVAIRVLSDGTVEVRAPKSISDVELDVIIASKEAWIKKKLAELTAQNSKIKEHKFADGELFLYLGHEYKLKLVDKQNVPLKLHGSFLLSRAYLPFARQLFINWYTNRAYEKIGERLKHYSEIMGLKYKKMGITGAQRRWGSCSTEGSINFSYRLVMAPIEVIDYVVVHELAHIKHPNHSKKFWATVEAVIPDYKEREKWLKENERLTRL